MSLLIVSWPSFAILISFMHILAYEVLQIYSGERRVLKVCYPILGEKWHSKVWYTQSTTTSPLVLVPWPGME